MSAVPGFTLSNDRTRLPDEEIHRWLARESYWSAHTGLQGFRRWMLSTRDGHGLYAKTGYAPLESPERWMERRPIRKYEE